MREFDRVSSVRGQERIADRTPFSKTFALGGGRRQCIITASPVHYETETGSIDDIDLEPRDAGRTWVIDRAPYVLTIPKNGGVVSYSGRLTRKQFVASTRGVPVIRDGAFVWSLADGREALLRPMAGRVSFETFLLDANAPPLDAWTYSENIGPLRAHDAAGMIGEVVDGRFTGRVSRRIDKAMRRNVWASDPTYPVRLF